MTNRRQLRVGFLWHSTNSGNLGVGALTVGNLMLVRDAATRAGFDARFTIIGVSDTGPDYVAGPDIDALSINTRTLLSPTGYWATLGRLDCVLDIGGGDSFADIYPAKRFAFIWLTKLMAILRDVPLLLSPQTIGPFTRQPYRALASWVMRRAFSVVARDPQSFDVARSMAPDTQLIEAVDVAFALPYERRRIGDDGKIDIGLNVSGLLFRGGFTGSNEFGLDVDYAALTRALLTALSERDDVRVHLLCHVNSIGLRADDDGEIADLLAREFPKVVRVPDFTSPSDAKSFISGLDLLIAARMHACIAAFSSGVPVLPIAYSRKFSGLFEGVLGYPHLLPVKGYDTASALAFLLDRVDRRAELAADVERGNAPVATALARYSAELDRLLASLAR